VLGLSPYIWVRDAAVKMLVVAADRCATLHSLAPHEVEIAAPT